MSEDNFVGNDQSTSPWINQLVRFIGIFFGVHEFFNFIKSPSVVDDFLVRLSTNMENLHDLLGECSMNIVLFNFASMICSVWINIDVSSSFFDTFLFHAKITAVLSTWHIMFLFFRSSGKQRNGNRTPRVSISVLLLGCFNKNFGGQNNMQCFLTSLFSNMTAAIPRESIFISFLLIVGPAASEKIDIENRGIPVGMCGIGRPSLASIIHLAQVFNSFFTSMGIFKFFFENSRCFRNLFWWI